MPRKPRPKGAIHVVTNRRHGKGREYVTHLLRRSYREGGKVKSETVGNISYLPEKLVEAVRAGLRGEPVGVLSAEIAIERSLPAGHVLAALAMARRLALARLLDRSRSRERDLCIAMILAYAVAPAAGPPMPQALAHSTLAEALGVASADADDLSGAMDWLADRQARIQARLARRHLASADLALYTVCPGYAEAACRGQAEPGGARLRRGPAWRIVYGVLCDRPGRPLAVEVLSGARCEDGALPSRVAELATQLSISRVVLCDRAKLTKDDHELLRAAGRAGRITSLTAPETRRLLAEGVLRASLFNEQDVCEVAVATYPGERLVACRDSLAAAFAHGTEAIEDEPTLDGIYVLRTTVGESELAAVEVIDSYTQVEQAERAFSCCAHVGLAMRPRLHALEDRPGGQAFLCMLACYLTWHLRRVWAPLLPALDPPDPDAGLRPGAERTARERAPSTCEGPHTYRTLLIELASLTRNTIRLSGSSSTFEQLSRPTPVQAHALELAERAPFCT